VEKAILGYTNGKIMIGVGLLIFYFDVSEHFFIKKSENRLSEINRLQNYSQTIEIQLEQIRKLIVENKYRLLAF